jgi:hypothetical protein
MSDDGRYIITLATAYQTSQLVQTCIETGIIDAMATGITDPGALAETIGADHAMTLRLLRAMAAFDLAVDLGERFKLTELGHALSGSMRDIALMYGGDLYRQTFARLTECVKTGGNAFTLDGAVCKYDHLDSDPKAGREFDAAMDVLGRRTGVALLSARTFGGCRSVVDIGGGTGAALRTLLEAYPDMTGTLFELPRIAGKVEATDRLKVIGGDMFAAVPAGAECYIISRVLHNWGDAQCQAILANCRAAMSSTARLLIVDRTVPDRITASAAARASALLDLRMMIATDGGRERTEAEFARLLKASLLKIEHINTLQTGDTLIEASPMEIA